MRAVGRAGARCGPVGWALVVCALLAGGCGGDEPPPNLVIVLSDALRAANLPLYGYPHPTAPRLEALAAEAVVFRHHFANYPGTPVSVSQMMTGRLAAPLLMNPAPVRVPVRAVPDDLLVLPAALRAAGYRTALISSHPWFEGAPLLDAFERVVLVPPAEGEVYAPFERLVPPALEVFERAAAAEQPFFLYLHSMDTHEPYRPHPGFGRRPAERGWPGPVDRYDAEIEYTDHGVGRLLDALRAAGLLERTVFVFTADHGEELGELGPEYWNRSHGYSVRRAQLHVPLVVRLPGGRLGGSVRTAPSQHLDLAPTLLRQVLPGASLDGFRLDGRDLGPRLGTDPVGEGEPYPPVFAYSWRYSGVFDGDLELHRDGWSGTSTLHRIATGGTNYPWPHEIDDPAAARRLGERARREERRLAHALATMPPLPPPAAPVEVGTPTSVLEGHGTMTYDRSTTDGLWLHDPARRLEAGPGEHPPPVTLAMPWIPGRYRVRMKLDRERLDEGWAGGLRVRLPLAGGPPVEVDGAGADAEGFVDLGEYDLGRTFAAEFAEPRGGVAVLAFRFEPAGAAAGGGDAEPAIDPELRERLRALGYID